jgi:hypothetical protein
MSLEHWMPKLNPALFEPLRAMSEPDPKTTLREFQEYLDLSYESPREFAARIGVAKETVWYWLSGRRQPKAMSLAKLRRFLDNEAKRQHPSAASALWSSQCSQKVPTCLPETLDCKCSESSG